jgi:hypothetical protein
MTETSGCAPTVMYGMLKGPPFQFAPKSGCRPVLAPIERI